MLEKVLSRLIWTGTRKSMRNIRENKEVNNSNTHDFRWLLLESSEVMRYSIEFIIEVVNNVVQDL